MLSCRISEHESTPNTPLPRIRTINTKKVKQVLHTRYVSWNERNSEMGQNTDDTRSTRTCWRGANGRYKDEAIRKRNIYRDKRTEKTKKRTRKQGKKTRNRTQGVYSNKASRLCFKAEPGTLSHDLSSSSYSGQQRYQVSSVSTAAVDPPLHGGNQRKPSKTTTTVVRAAV